MNILFLTKEIPYPPDSGARLRSWHVLKALRKEGNTITMVCFDNGKNPLGLAEMRRLGEVHTFAPIPYPQGRWNIYKHLLTSYFLSTPSVIHSKYSKEMHRKVAEIVSNKGIDLIVCDSIYLASHMVFKGAKTVLNEHNVESTIIRRNLDLEKSLFWKLHLSRELNKMIRYENIMWKAFNKTLMCSEVDLKEMERRIGERKGEVVPNGVDIHAFAANGTAEEPCQLIYTGLMGWKPNEDAVVYFGEKIYPKIKQRFPQVKFLIVGKDPTPAVQALAAKDVSISVTGFVEDVRPFVHKATVFVVPLRIGSGTRLKILEAFAMEKAVVSTSIGAEGLNVTGGKDIMIGDSPEAFTNGVIKLIEDKNLRRTLGQNGRRLVEEGYSWERIDQLLNGKVLRF